MDNRFRTMSTDADGGTTVIIPARFNRQATRGIIPNALIVVFYFASVMPNLVKSNQPLELIVAVNAFFLTGLFAFLAYNLFTTLWCHYGKETFTVDRSTCTLSKTIFGVGPQRRFDLTGDVSITAVDPAAAGKRKNHLLRSIGIGSGSVRIASGGKEYFFGAALKEAETYELLEKVKSYREF